MQISSPPAQPCDRELMAAACGFPRTRSTPGIVHTFSPVRKFRIVVWASVAESRGGGRGCGRGADTRPRHNRPSVRDSPRRLEPSPPPARRTVHRVPRRSPPGSATARRRALPCSGASPCATLRRGLAIPTRLARPDPVRGDELPAQGALARRARADPQRPFRDGRRRSDRLNIPNISAEAEL